MSHHCNQHKFIQSVLPNVSLIFKEDKLISFIEREGYFKTLVYTFRHFYCNSNVPSSASQMQFGQPLPHCRRWMWARPALWKPWCSPMTLQWTWELSGVMPVGRQPVGLPGLCPTCTIHQMFGDVLCDHKEWWDVLLARVPHTCLQYLCHLMLV